ncbi:MAG: hypothetical protein IT449_17920 [Phycisphaerales bacterium]|nr:hypothetical protein [Phycisphaerales bacterium]
MRFAALIRIAALVAAPVFAQQNIDLSTVPPRDTVQLTIYNSEDLTLVRETRTVSFKQGINPLQFSWANTLIDASSVQMRIKTQTDKLELLDTTYPHDKPQMLYWNVRSTMDGDASLEITYFTSGLSWAADYVCVSDPDETKMSFEGFVRITNSSGEDYENAQVRLVVGTINLVEKIQELAQRGIISQEQAGEMLREGAFTAKAPMPADARVFLGKEVAGRMDFAGGAGAEAKQIIKEGLSEYFIYTVEGTETLRNTWSKRMRLFEGKAAPFHIQYRYRPQEYGEQLVRMFLLRNDEKSQLGLTPLPDGTVRLFRNNGKDGLSMLAQQYIKYVPIGQEIELNLGPDPEVIHECILLRGYRDNTWFHRRTANLYYNPAQGHQIKMDDQVSGWDEHGVWTDRIRNYRAKPIDLEMRRAFDGDVVFHSDLNPTLHDYRTVQFKATIQPAEKKDLQYRVTTRNGYNQKEQHVTLEAGS